MHQLVLMFLYLLSFMNANPNLVEEFLNLLDLNFSWFKPLPNQFHRLTHNSYFLNNDRNSLGVKSLEGLERGNYTTHFFDQFHTYKGDRKKANRGVFKLLRLKSNRTLRKYKIRSNRIQRCSKCNQIGHNSTNKTCPSNVDLTDMIEDMVDESMDSLEDVNMNDANANAEEREESVNIDDLLQSDDEELF